MKRPKIAIFMDQLSPGSFPKIAGGEVKQLNKLGINTELLLIKQGIPDMDREWLNGVDAECLEDRLPSALRANFKIPGFSFFSFFHLTAPIYGPLIIKKKYDLIIAHGTYTCFTAYSLRKLKDIPYIAFIHDPIFYILQKVYPRMALRHMLPLLCPLGERIDKVITNSSEIVVLPSKYHLDLLKKLTHRPVAIVYPGVETSKKIPEKRENYILAVARWELGKKPFFYIDLLKRLREEDLLCDLVMVGPWRERSLQLQFLREVKRHRLVDCIKLYGPANRDELIKLYRGAKVLVHATVESFGMIGLEAAAHGCPFIIPQNSGVTDLFNHETQVFFPKEGDVDAYVTYLSKLFADDVLSYKIGYKFWAIAKRYTWRKHVDSLLRIVERYTSVPLSMLNKGR